MKKKKIEILHSGIHYIIHPMRAGICKFYLSKNKTELYFIIYSVLYTDFDYWYEKPEEEKSYEDNLIFISKTKLNEIHNGLRQGEFYLNIPLINHTMLRKIGEEFTKLRVLFNRIKYNKEYAERIPYGFYLYRIIIAMHLEQILIAEPEKNSVPREIYLINIEDHINQLNINISANRYNLLSLPTININEKYINYIKNNL